MIVWLNGPFGGGKTTLAAGLCQSLPGAMVADPKAVGDLLRSTLAGHALRFRDYEDLPLWRQLTGVFVAGLVRHAGGPVIAPMTVLNPAYTEEIFTLLRRADGSFHHLVVHAAPVALQEPIAANWEFPGDAERSEAVRIYRRRRAPDYQHVREHASQPRPPPPGCTPTATSSTPAPSHPSRPFKRPWLTCISRPRTAPTTGGTRGMTFTIHAVQTLVRAGRHPFAPRPRRARGAWS